MEVRTTIKVSRPRFFLHQGTYRWRRQSREVELSPLAEGVIVCGVDGLVYVIRDGRVAHVRRAATPLRVERRDGSLACIAIPRSHIYVIGEPVPLPYDVPEHIRVAISKTRDIVPYRHRHVIALAGEVDGGVKVVYLGTYGGWPFIREGVIRVS